MNVSEANAVNTILQWVIGAKDATGELVPDEHACEQAAWLADRANHAIWAGLNGERVGAQWPTGGGLPL